jgi:type VI secretion system protein VasJ
LFVAFLPKNFNFLIVIIMDSEEKTLITFFDDWVKPIDNDSYQGEEAIFSPEYELIREEVEKNASIHQNISTNWKLVLERSNTFLSTQSKDIWILCYAVRAIYEEHGLKSFRMALEVLLSILKSHWDELYPSTERIVRRAAPLTWLVGRIEAIMVTAIFPKDEGQIADTLRKTLSDLENFLKENLKDNSPSFKGVIEAIPKKIEQSQESSNVPDFSDVLASSMVKTSPMEPSLPDDRQNMFTKDGKIALNQLPRVFREIKEFAQSLAKHFLTQNIIDPRIYLLHRTALWCTITQLPEAMPNGITQLRPIPNDRALSYSSAVEDHRFSEILPQLEISAGKMPFWFDGHHMVAKCLEGLEAEEALDIVKITLSHFISLFPQLIDYKYYDSTPFASTKTIHWIAGLKYGESLNFKPKDILSEEVSKQDAVNSEENILKEALNLAKEQGFKKGLSHLGSYQLVKSRFSIKKGYIVARYCLAAGRPMAALNILKELYDKLEAWMLLDWEPELSYEIIKLIISVSIKQRIDIPNNIKQSLYWYNINLALEYFPEKK